MAAGQYFNVCAVCYAVVTNKFSSLIRNSVKVRQIFIFDDTCLTSTQSALIDRRLKTSRNVKLIVFKKSRMTCTHTHKKRNMSIVRQMIDNHLSCVVHEIEQMVREERNLCLGLEISGHKSH